MLPLNFAVIDLTVINVLIVLGIPALMPLNVMVALPLGFAVIDLTVVISQPVDRSWRDAFPRLDGGAQLDAAFPSRLDKHAQHDAFPTTGRPRVLMANFVNAMEEDDGPNMRFVSTQEAFNGFSVHRKWGSCRGTHVQQQLEEDQATQPT